MAMWKHLGDNLKNGTILGALFGLAICYGVHVYNFLLLAVPSAWLVLGSFSIPVYLAFIFAIVGYIIDKK